MLESLQTNTTISHYRIIRKIGAGGMGEVFPAQDTRIKRKVALRILPGKFMIDSDRLIVKSIESLKESKLLQIYFRECLQRIFLRGIF